MIFRFRLGYYERTQARYTVTKLTNEVSSHYQNQFMKQIHVLVFGLDVLGNPFGVIRGLAEGVESFFYEPYKVMSLFCQKKIEYFYCIDWF